MNRSTQIKALSSEARLTILKLLAAPKEHFAHQYSADPAAFGMCMTLIAEALAISQPAASNHLSILRQAGFITVRKQQKWSYCKRDEAAIADYLAWLSTELTTS